MSVSNDKTRLFLGSGYSLKVLQQHIKNENSHANEIPNCPILEKTKHVRKSMNIIDQINNHLTSKNYMMVSRNRPKRLSSDPQIKRPEIKRYLPPSKRTDISLNSDKSACESNAPQLVSTNFNDLPDGSPTNSPPSKKTYLQNIVNNDKRYDEQLVNKNPKAKLIIKDKKIVREYKDDSVSCEELPISNLLIDNLSQKNCPLVTSEHQSEISLPIVSQTNEINLTSPTSTIPTMLLVKDALNREKRITLAPQQSPIKVSLTRHDQWHNIYMPPGARRSLSFSEENDFKPKNPANAIFPATHLNPSSFNSELNASNRLYDPFRDLIRQNQPCMLPQSNGYNTDPIRRPITPIVHHEHEHAYNNSYYLTPPQYPSQTHAFDGYGPSTTNYLSREPLRNCAAALYDNSLDPHQQPQAEYSPSKSSQRGDVRILKKEFNNLLGDLRIGDNGGGGGKRSRVNSTKTAENSWSQYFGEEDISDKLDRVIEVSGFPIEFKTVDLTNILTNTGDADMDILWVDDDHALAVFTSAYFASEALKMNHPLVKCKPYEQACAKSKAKGQKNLDFVFTNLTSNRVRPLTTVVVARRFIENHLGVKCNVSSETRLKEAHTLKEAAALGKKKIAAEKKKIDPWDE